MAPDADEEGHRDKHDFPEEEEEEQIERKEHADDTNFEHQQHDKEFFYAVLDAVPGREDGDRRQERGENHQEDAEAVDAHMKVDRR